MKIKKYLPIIGIGLFIYILTKIGISQTIQEISQANLFFLLVALFFVLISLITGTLKWFIIARKQKIKIQFYQAFKINFIGIFYGFVTPSKIGGIVRAEYLRKYNNNSLGKGVSNYVLDKVLDLCSLGFLAVVFSFTFSLISTNYFYFSLAGLILMVSFLLIFGEESKSKKILRIFYRFVPVKKKNKFKKSFYSFYKDMPEKKHFVLFFLFNIVNWIILYTITFFVGVSLGINISFFYYLAILPIATLVGQIPITISGLGTREATMISLFSLFGVGATKIFSMSMLSLVMGIIPAIIGSFLIWKNKN